MFSKKKKGNSNSQSKAKNIYPIAAFMALIVAVVLYFVMIHAEKTALSDYEKAPVIITKSEVPINMVITEDNVDKYFEEISFDKKFIPEDSIADKTLLYGKAPCFTMDNGTFITNGMFKNINEYINSMEDPRVAAIMVNDLSQIVGGVIRAGDTIDIYVINEKKEESMINIEEEKPLFTNIYVYEAFDATGIKIDNDDNTSVCQMVNVLYENSEIYDFYKELAKGTVYIVKHIDEAE